MLAELLAELLARLVLVVRESDMILFSFTLGPFLLFFFQVINPKKQAKKKKKYLNSGIVSNVTTLCITNFLIYFIIWFS